jgi:serine protease Do
MQPVAALAALLLTLPAVAAGNKTVKGVPKGVAVPNDTALAIYIPRNDLKERFFADRLGIWVEPGLALATARDTVGAQLFTTARAAEAGGEGSYGLLVDLDPEWSAVAGKLQLQLAYKVFAPETAAPPAAGATAQADAPAAPPAAALSAGPREVLAGTQTAAVPIGTGGAGGGFATAALRATQAVLVDVLAKLQPSAGKFPATGSLAVLKPDLLVNREKPVSSGTAFYINSGGQLLTAAHVVDDCVLLEGQRDGRPFPVQLRSSSKLLDVAVVDSQQATDKQLVFRKDQPLTLGESVTNVGYPLAGLLAVTPNLTRGNVSARAGLKGAAGIFQFSAPIQPGASGGPVVSDAGELLGITVGTLNAARLIQEGILPQNVNFALEARYAAMFLKQAGVPFQEVDPRTGGSMQMANDAALAAVVQLNCYQ